jgi:CheY-like chemotaxis protein
MVYGDENMFNIDRLTEDKIIEVAQNMGYDPNKPKELQKYKTIISQMDQWDISRILFFGRGLFMREIMEWLLKNEEAAQKIYETAAEFFREDNRFHIFLKALAEDEALHVRIMGTALNFLRKKTGPIEEAILLDLDTRSRIDRHIAHIQDVIAMGNLSKKAMTEYIINVERSEWNKLFMYVVNTLKTECPEFSTVGPKLQHHLRSIDRYMETAGGNKKLTGAFRALKPIWDEQILIVDDSPVITELLSELLSKVGNIETAQDGAAALSKSIHQYYAVIISDISMPVMDGINFVKNLESFHKNVAERFIFMTGFPNQDVVDFCLMKNIPLLRKPFMLNELNDCVYKILENNVRDKPLQQLALN